MPPHAPADRPALPEDRRVFHRGGGKLSGPHGDAAFANLAARQYGVVSRRQLLAVGATSRMIERRLESGHLVRVHRGVYAVGHRRLTRDGFWLAAVLACGDGAALSHRDAAELHGLLPASGGARTDVTSPARRTAPARVRLHHRSALAQVDLTTVARIPVTTVARTLVDLAGTPLLRKALHEAERRLLLDVRALQAAMERTRGRRGAGHAALHRLLDELARDGAQQTRSELEERFLALVSAHGLPRPRTNAHLHGMEVDAHWPARRLVVELDGDAFHRTRADRQRDRTKENALAELGFDVRRYTWDDVTRRPETVARQLRAALGARPAITIISSSC